MSDFCKEEVIRKAADWRAFKLGKDLIAAVEDAAPTESGWRGVVRDGRKPLRVVVIARSATDLEVRCPCRENQSTGAFCAHAVAVGLALVSGKFRKSETQSSVSEGAEKSTVTQAEMPSAVSAWQVELPPPWMSQLARGRLTAKITRLEEEPTLEDARLSFWLRDVGAPKGGMIQLSADAVAGFFTTVAEHPRIRSSEGLVEVLASGVLEIESVVPSSDRVVVVPRANEILSLGEGMAVVTPVRVSLVSKALPSELRGMVGGNPVEIAMGRFLEIVESLGEVFVWPSEGWLAGLQFLAAEAEITIALETKGRALEARPRVSYANAEPVVVGAGKVPGLPMLVGNKCFTRDLASERQVVAELERCGFKRSGNEIACWKLIDEVKIADFLNEELQSFRSRYRILSGPGLSERIREVAEVTPVFEFVGQGQDWLEFNLSFQTSDSNSLLDSSEVWRMLNSGNPGKSKRVSRELSEVIEPLFSELDLRQENGRFIARGASVDCIRKIHENSHNGLIANGLDDINIPIPSSLSAEMRGYQAEGYAWLWRRLDRFGGALLADDMGLGKTLQTIALIERMFEICPESNSLDGGSVLVVATTSLLGNWRAEFEKFAPGRRVRILHGSGRDVEKERVGVGEVWLTSYGTLARDLAWYLRRDYMAVVVDEASLMRNPDTDHAKAICKLRASKRLALTGTPVENGVRDLWAIFRFIQPGWLGGRRDFHDRYEVGVKTGDRGAMRRLQIKTAPFMLRRTKEEVAKDLPAKLIIDEYVELSKPQKAVYRDLLVEGRRGVDRLADAKQDGAARMQMLTSLLRLRQACCDLSLLGNDRLKRLSISDRSAKLERLHELLDEAISGGHKVLVFSQFKTQLEVISDSLRGREIDVLQLDGSTRNRQDLVDRFQAVGGPPVFLISLKAGGYGLNLTAADVVIHFDPWWNPAAEAQASDRAHRIGQTRPVTVYRLLTRGTVEEKVVALNRQKRAIAEAVDESGGGAGPGWSADELASLLEDG